MPELVIRHDRPRPFLCLTGVIHRHDVGKRVAALAARFSKLTVNVPHLGPQVALYHPQGRDPFGPDGEPFWLGREMLVPFDAPAGLQIIAAGMDTIAHASERVDEATRQVREAARAVGMTL